MTTFQPLLVRAQLTAGVAHAAPWGTALDGLLAAQLWRRHKLQLLDAGQPPRPLHDTDAPIDLDLPLARCTTPDGTWHWAATCAYPTTHHPVPPDVHTWTARTDIDAWLIWNIWQVSNPRLADVVPIEPDFAIYRDTGVALTEHGAANPQAKQFIAFLQSTQGSAIFAKWGWQK